MKKILYLIVFLLILIGAANLTLRSIQIKAIKGAMDGISRSLASAGFSLDFKDPEFSGIFFWNISGEIKDSELFYSLFGSSLSFKIPKILIQNKLVGLETKKMTIVIPRDFEGRASFSTEVSKHFDISQDYRTIVDNEKDLKFCIETDGILSPEKAIAFSFQSNNLTFSLKEESEKYFKKIFDVKELKLLFNSEGQGSLLGCDFELQDLNFYLRNEKMLQRLPVSISIEDASRNISSKIKFLKKITKKDDLTTTEYDGSFNAYTKAFNLSIDGKNIKKENKKSKTTNEIDLTCQIGKFDTFFDYVVSVVKAFKKDNDRSYSEKDLIETSNLFKNIVLENSQKQDDKVVFHIKDAERQTSFEGKPIEEVFAQILRKLNDFKLN